MDTTFNSQLIYATASAAVAVYPWIGRGANKLADQAAVDAIRKALNQININGTIVIGEGERDKAPMLYIGEKVGSGHGPETQIALDPLEGTTITSEGGSGAMTVVSAAQNGGLLHAPDVYMNKLIINLPSFPDGISLDSPIEKNLELFSQIKNKPISEITVCMLKRDRHKEQINSVRRMGARMMLITDGDIAASIQVALNNIDIYMGIGGAPEGIISASILQCLKGSSMQGKLIFSHAEEITRAKKFNITDLDRIYSTSDLAKGNIVCALSGVTSGSILPGVQKRDNCFIIHTWLLTSDGTQQSIVTQAPLNYFHP